MMMMMILMMSMRMIMMMMFMMSMIMIMMMVQPGSEGSGRTHKAKMLVGPVIFKVGESMIRSIWLREA